MFVLFSRIKGTLIVMFMSLLVCMGEDEVEIGDKQLLKVLPHRWGESFMPHQLCVCEAQAAKVALRLHTFTVNSIEVRHSTCRSPLRKKGRSDVACLPQRPSDRLSTYFGPT